jgi:RNA polymerase sigma-70 factor (ECF subfamily)
MQPNTDPFWTLVKNEQAKAVAFCRKLTGSHDDGDDLYQDSLVTALRKFETLRDTSAFRSWLYRIISNRYKNSLRRNWKNRFLPLTGEVADQIGTGNPTAAHSARRILETALVKLTAEERSLIILFELEGWTIRELAHLMNRKESAVKVRLHRIRKKMRRAIEKHQAQANQKKVRKHKVGEDGICVAAKSGAK